MEFDSIDAVREEIDQLDHQLVALIARRGECVKAAAQFKQDRAAVRAPDRVQQVIDKVRGQAKAQGLSEEIIEQVYRAMIAAFIDYELQQHRCLQEK
ncbi:chorismate mutase [Pantoea sp. BL1]|uniref:chorismate mutase n=1 Tax=unclassified Pantoea TaxID=2630326 RepID=UPI0005F7D84F|nr:MULTISPECIES: chorismate mutase [unclassified Pantoea]KJV30211.1 chorismate mutase [Pantoea sp. SM3]KJV48908.1 chorismate mutase [Pantoea sp. BL1]